MFVIAKGSVTNKSPAKYARDARYASQAAFMFVPYNLDYAIRIVFFLRRTQVDLSVDYG